MMMMMRTILFFTISLIKGHMAGNTDSVTGIAGGSIILNSQYKDKTSVKRFCRVSDNKCTEAQSHLWHPNEQITMTENKSMTFLSVLIRNLTVNDRGEYRWENNNKLFKLNVEQDPCCGRSEEQTAYIQGTAIIHCKYPKGFHDSPKQLFKEQNGSLESIFKNGGFILPKDPSNPRFSINVNHNEEHMFTVTLTNVSRHDEGLYFCAAHKSIPISYSPLFNEIQLHVTDSSIVSITIVTVSVSLIVLFTVALGLLLITKKCKKTKVLSDERNTGDDDEINSSPYYASVQDSGNTVLYQLAKKPKSLNAVYAMAHLPASHSDSDFYTLAEEPRRNES